MLSTNLHFKFQIYEKWMKSFYLNWFWRISKENKSNFFNKIIYFVIHGIQFNLYLFMHSNSLVNPDLFFFAENRKFWNKIKKNFLVTICLGSYCSLTFHVFLSFNKRNCCVRFTEICPHILWFLPSPDVLFKTKK